MNKVEEKTEKYQNLKNNQGDLKENLSKFIVVFNYLWVHLDNLSHTSRVIAVSL